MITEIEETNYKMLQSAYHTMINALRNLEITEQRPNKRALELLLTIRELQSSMLFLLGECEYELLGNNTENVNEKRFTTLHREREILKKWIPKEQLAIFGEMPETNN